MTDAAPITIAVDAVGGDNAPDAILKGLTAALSADPGMNVILVGPSNVVDPYAGSQERVTPEHATESIEMEEHAASAIRAKKDSSIVVGCKLVRDRRAQAFFSAGNTGAMMAASILIMGRLPGVSRPAIATVLPTASKPVVLLDVGANADSKPENLLQFGQMGAAYSHTVLGVPAPSVGLLNIGEEATKGSVLAQEAHVLLAERMPGFFGNVQGSDVPTAKVDVVVTDGFTGNVALKVMEGLAEVTFGLVETEVFGSPINQVAANVLKPSLAMVRDRLDEENYGGAPLLGVNGLSFIGHGISGPRAVASGLEIAATAVRGDLLSRITEALADGNAS